MGDLGFEYQDAVIAANYTHDKNKTTAYELVYQTPDNTTIEEIETLLKNVGIDGSTYHFSNGKITITTFSEEETNEVINKLKDTEYGYKGHKAQNSRYLDNEHRGNAYQRWLNAEGHNTQNRQLSDACSKALAICEAAARFPDTRARVSTEGYRKGDPQKNPNNCHRVKDRKNKCVFSFASSNSLSAMWEQKNPPRRRVLEVGVDGFEPPTLCL